MTTLSRRARPEQLPLFPEGPAPEPPAPAHVTTLPPDYGAGCEPTGTPVPHDPAWVAYLERLFAVVEQ